MRSRNKKKKDPEPTEDISSLWEYVFVEQFLKVFRSGLVLDEFATEELANVLKQNEDILKLEKIFASLLRFLLDRENVSTSEWQNVMLGVLKKSSPDWIPLKGGIKFSQLSTTDKALLLKLLVDLIMEKKIEDIAGGSACDGKKLIMVGEDAESSKYWYFGDLNLYREEPSKRGEQASWETVCTEVLDWDRFIRKFQRSSDSEEKKLYQHVRDVIYPMVKNLAKVEDPAEKISPKRKKSAIKSEDKVVNKNKEENVEDKKLEGDTTERNQEERKPAMIETHEKEEKSVKNLIAREFSSTTKAQVSEKDDQVFEEDELEIDSSEEMSQETSSVKTDIGTDERNVDLFTGRSKRKCVIAREQQTKKKEWWEEENILSDEEEEEEEDDSDSSDGPKKKKKKRKSVNRPIEMPEPPNRIYVFSSGLANRAAEAVLQRRCENIVAFHRSQPTSTPYLRVDRSAMNQSMIQFRQNLAGVSSGQQMLQSGFNGNMPTTTNSYGSGYGTPKWSQYPYQQQYQKQQQDRQPSQIDDIHSFMYGNSFNNAAQMGSSGIFNQQGFPQQFPSSQPRPQYNMPQHMSMQSQQHQQSFFKDQVPEHFRPPMQQQSGPATQQGNSQPSQQPQQFFPSQAKLHSPPPQSPSNTQSPLNASVKSPPPPYPGQGPESSSTRNPVTSPGAVPSPSASSASVGSPKTPLTPHTPRFPGIPSPGDAQRPPFSPGVQSKAPQFPSTVPPSFPTPTHQDSSPASSGNPKFIELSKTLPLQPQHSPSYNFQQPRLPEDQLEGQETRREGFTSLNGMGQEQLGRGDIPTRSPSSSGPPNQNPFFSASQSAAPNRNPFVTPQTNVKSFSVESLTAPRDPSSKYHPEMAGLPQGQNVQYTYPPQTGFHYPTGKYPSPMLAQSPYLQYPPGIQHPSSQYYPSQLGPPNMYLNRNSLPTYPGGRGGGL